MVAQQKAKRDELIKKYQEKQKKDVIATENSNNPEVKLKNDNDMLDISKAKLPQKYVSFVSLRRDLHPVVPNMQTKKRKLEATIDLVKMTNHGPLTHRQALLRKRFKCN